MKKYLVKNIIFVLFLILLTSCKKNFYKSEVNGRVIDEVTGEGISGIKVYLLGTTTSLASSGPIIEDEDTYTSTDSQGNFSFRFNRSEYGNTGYYLYAKYDESKYFAFGSSGDMIPLKFERSFRKEKITKDIFIEPLGTLKIKVTKTQVPNEYIDIKLIAGGTLFQGYSGESNIILTAIKARILYNLKVTATKYDTTNWSIKSSVENHYSIPVTRFDTTYYQLNY